MSTVKQPAPLRPRWPRVYVVRWIRADGTETLHRTFTRRPAALACAQRQRDAGRTEVGVFAATVNTWRDCP